MISTSRPSLRSSGVRSAQNDRHKTRGATAGHDDSIIPTPAKSTRRTTHTTQSHAVDSSTASSRKRLKLDPESSPLLRKASAAAITRTPANDRPRPPSKLSVTQPSGDLVQIVNGVKTTISLGADHVPSPSLTPTSNGIPPTETGARPNAEQKTQDKRTLRSKIGGSRLKSDLSIYFSNYEDIITDAPREPEFLGIDTHIYILDDTIKQHKSHSEPSGPVPSSSPQSRRSLGSITNPPNQSTSQRRPSHSAFQTIDFSSINKHTHNEPLNKDPLSDDVYFASHRRAERKEKQLRNIEKERAMHEKVQLERLLDGLRGADWLRVMGITGITDGERRDWEPKRNYFISEVKALVDKFKLWKEEEKRIRLEKEAALHAREEDEDTSKVDSEAESDVEESDAPNSSDIDASAAHQLLQEASSASNITRKPRTRALPLYTYLAPVEPESTTPFTSFYQKPHLRAAALGQQRHGRTALAFGIPIPESQDAEFSLPHDYLTPDALKDHARKKRRMKRESSGATR